ncbi:MAG: cell division ATP-binding protein FtsE [Desulfobacterales bacterium]|nr:cell division ATP-binding protein FtsE [Desulfobacterales bacterium]MBF0396628.1 cell division ATP-binding protein FtsE [Desulfobacterales bacterium]
MENQNNEVIIQLFHVHKRYGGKNAIIDVTVNFFKNEFVFITGPSGAGKSTLMKLLYLGEPASEGQIIIEGVNLSRLSNSQIPFLRRKFGIIFQDFRLINTKNVYENVSLVLESMGMNRKYIQKKVKIVLRMVGMEDRGNNYPLSLSGGEQQRIAIARAMVGDPKIILADEPTASLDSESADAVLELLKTAHSKGTTIIVSTHDKELIRKMGTRVLHLKEGQVQE